MYDPDRQKLREIALFRFRAAVSFGLNPLEEEAIVRDLDGRLVERLADRESETINIVINAAGEDQSLPNGSIGGHRGTCLRRAADRLSYDRVVPIASSLKRRALLAGTQADLIEQIGEALLIQQRLAGRVELTDRPDVLWDRPELEHQNLLDGARKLLPLMGPSNTKGALNRSTSRAAR
jgi:uncharacterized Rmd1/YagE family protein